MVGEIPAGMIMYLINAVYFKGDWTSAFDRGRTADADFHLASGGTVQVPMMHVNAGFRTFYSEQAAVHGVELPYGGGAFTALAIAPWDDRPIADVLTDLTPGEWDAWMAALDAAEPADAMVALPRFGLEYERTMNEDLQALGMTDAFDPVLADFSRLVQGGGVHISEVKQKTFLKVDEEGTEAAAATSVGVRVVSAPPYFRFDRPFLFAIRERFSGTILFIGVIGDPGV
jgi:serpin B